jgi:uncharacterized protein (TIGR02246 family)
MLRRLNSRPSGGKGNIVADEFERIEGLYAAIAAALAAGDLTALSTNYTDDAVQFPPDGAPLVGWARIRESLEKVLNDITFNSAVELSEIAIFGEFAYAWGSYRGISSSKSSGGIATTSGSFLDVLARQPDGSWRIVRSAWSNHKLDKASY